MKIIKHAEKEGLVHEDGVAYHFFRRNDSFGNIPKPTHHFILKEKPSVVMVQGLIYPFQVLALRKKLGPAGIILAQHHGERPYRGFRKLMQRRADRQINAYLFTSLGNAKEWVEAGIIRDISKCHELLEASTFLRKQDREQSRARLNLSGNNFLWVGRLNRNKDPLTVIEAFEKFLAGNKAVLHMIYQDDALLPELKSRVNDSSLLSNAVRFVGKIRHEELALWYSAADFYISGSHSEGSGYALIESMACGCIPLVTDIPSYRKIIGEGQAELLYPPGDPNALASLLGKTKSMDREKISAAVHRHFDENLSFQNIAENLRRICDLVISSSNESHKV